MNPDKAQEHERKAQADAELQQDLLWMCGPRPGQIWKHYEGDFYEIIAVGIHEATLEPLVTYRCVEKGSPTRVRPLSVWREEVTLPDGSARARYELHSWPGVDPPVPGRKFLPIPLSLTLLAGIMAALFPGTGPSYWFFWGLVVFSILWMLYTKAQERTPS